MKKKYLFNSDTEKVINGEKTAIILPLECLIGIMLGDCEYAIYDDKIYLSKNGRGVGEYKLPLAVGGVYFVCQNGKELGIEEFRGGLKWLDRRAVGVEYLRNKFIVESARVCRIAEVTDDEWVANRGCDVVSVVPAAEYVVVYRISIVR